MLVRAARRQVRRDTPPYPLSTRRLPVRWLCPASTPRRVHTTSKATVSSSSESRRQWPTLHVAQRKEIRPLATASDAHIPRQDSIPFQGLPSPLSWQGNSQGNDLFFNPQPLLLNENLFTERPKIGKKDGLGGDPAEWHQNLQACLRIGRLDRAAGLVQRLTEVYVVGAPEATFAHNLYLRALSRSVDGSHKASYAEMREWYDDKMVREGVVPNAETFVIMLQSSIATLEGDALEQAVSGYIEQALQHNVYEEVMSNADFSSKEWATLLRLQPEYFEALGPIDEQLDEASVSPSLSEESADSTISLGQAAKIKPVPQRGFGLQTLQKALAVFEESNNADTDGVTGTDAKTQKAIAELRQLRLEEDGVNAAIERWRRESEALGQMGISPALQRKSIAALMWQWLVAIKPLIAEELTRVREVLAKKAEVGSRLTTAEEERIMYGPYLAQFDADTLAAVTIITIMTSVAHATEEAFGQRVSHITLKIGNQLEDEEAKIAAIKGLSSMQRIKKTAQRAEILSKLNKAKKQFKMAMRTAPMSVRSEILSQDSFLIPTTAKAKIGALLVEKLLQSATVTTTRTDPQTGQSITLSVPAFSHSVSFSGGKKVGIIAIQHELHARLRKEPVKGAIPARLPMLTEPRPWSGFKDGGFLRYPVPVVRMKSSQNDEAQRSYAASAIAKGDMDTVLAGLDVLGRTPWQVNRNVFDVMVEAWNSGEAIGELAPENPQIELPPEPQEGDLKARLNYMSAVKAAEATKAGFHSQRCFQNFQLEIARAFLDETFYYPHNLDFRGRAYPIPQILNHMGADVARGLLIFGKGKELGDIGLRWLKIHLANLAGFDKASFGEREQFAMDHLDDIYDSASNPLSGRRWWLKGEDPWQLLGACFELKAALSSPDPTKYVSKLPVHQDGTCNGLQHYAALGGDKVGASQVNLVPGDRPADIYTGVAELVKKQIKEDASKGITAGLLLDGRITRKVVKQTVMTNVYGVTFAGACQQVLNQLDDIFTDFKPVKDVHAVTTLAAYTARHIFRALSSMFNGAHDIQYWLGECAQRISTSLTQEQIKAIDAELNGREAPDRSRYRVAATKKKATKVDVAKSPRASNKDIAKSFKSTVIWTTPLKMPIVQPYRASQSKTVKTCLQNIALMEPTTNEPVSKRKQLQGFPPNFIHSLDATHMTLSALKCSELGLTFAAVHDSFWTHAADVPVLSTVLRDAFVRMHSEDIIGRLAEEFKARYGDSMYLASISMESEAGKKIMQWRVADVSSNGGFKRSAKTSSYQELLLEKKRIDLLKSEDPEKRKQGAAMVTPGSIFEEFDGSASPSSSPSEHNLLGDEKGSLAAAAEAEMEMAEAEADGESATEKNAMKLNVGNARKAGRVRQEKLQFWLPLTFPPVPKKGDFDVSRLKQSQYFFS